MGEVGSGGGICALWPRGLQFQSGSPKLPPLGVES